MNWRSFLHSKTRDPAFLWKLVAVIVAIGIACGFIAQTMRGEAPRVLTAEPHSGLSWHEVELLAAEGQWWQVWWSVLEHEWSSVRPAGVVVLAVVAGSCWLLFLLQTMKVRGLHDPKLWCAVVAVALGVLSIWPTMFFVVWQAHVWNIRDSVELLPGIRYFVVGVGLREELSKAVCVLPLLPAMLKFRSELTALVLSGCVGLGFAAAENTDYFQTGTYLPAMGRYVTANPLHVALTGLVGLALYRACCNLKVWGQHAVLVFVMAVLAHGMYDAAILVPGLADIAPVSIIIFALVTYQFFHELRGLRPVGGDTISLSANFLFGISTVTAATFIYLSWIAGTGAAFDALAVGFLEVAVMVYLFLREMPETLVKV